MRETPESQVVPKAAESSGLPVLKALVEEMFCEHPGGEPALSELLGARQLRLGAALERVRYAIFADAFAEASREFEAFGSDLERQLRAEEDIVFRELERLQPRSEDRATLVLWMEHGEIRERYEDARRRFKAGENPLQVVEELGRMLHQHKLHEELLLCSRLELVEDPRAVRRILRCLEQCLAW
jgi:hypothetical protein